MVWKLMRLADFSVAKRFKGAYKDTINNPKFPFAMFPSSDLRIAVNGQWNEFFKRQSRFTQRPTFVLHDGPPYANGHLHVGHALNKFLKDLTTRYKVLCGHRVQFIPGWDCHGLPIELKAACDLVDPSPTQIREKASLVASKYIGIQMESFTEWGVLGEWSNYYSTMNPAYEAKELNAFADLHLKNLVYRHLLPVYWSGQSKTALAESELEYNSEHISKSLYLKVKLRNANEIFPSLKGYREAYAVLWTTTPWTLPANEAVLFDPSSRYICLKCSPSGEVFLIGKNFVERFSSMLSGQKLSVLGEFPGSQLHGLSYEHPIRRETSTAMPFLPAAHVVETVGTGLVHCAPCHGKEDFEVGRNFGLPMTSLVDESACYKNMAGPTLTGLSVLEEGNRKVLEMVEPMTVLVESVKHSYPYDWRTKTPIITRLSEQWFVDTEKLAGPALEAYKGVEVIPSNHKPSMLPFLTSRPRWCISRQRAWGVPIPVLYSKRDDAPIVDYHFIEHIASRAAQSGTDFWFLESVRELVPERFLSKWSLSPDEIRKSMDVFDVWFDSGLSWLCAMSTGSSEKERLANLYLEGPDQFRGWFSASLLLSVALQGHAPYRKLVVHGFTSDSTGRKMSKSLGNVIYPEQLIQDQNGCVDVLRRWAAFSGLDAVCSVGSKEMGQHAASYKMLRNSFRFLLGNLYDFDPVEQYGCLTDNQDMVPRTANELVLALGRAVSKPANLCNGLSTLDLAVLCWLGQIVSMALDNSYANYRFDNLLSEVDQVVSRISSVYFTSVKDVLYCDAASSSKRRAVQTVFWLTVECFKLLLAPLLPYLMEEVEQTCARQWSSTSPVIYRPMSVLERFSDNTLQSWCSEPTQSDWLTCLHSMRQWMKHKDAAKAVELAHSLHHECIGVLDSQAKTGSSKSSVVALLSSSHCTICVPTDQSDDIREILKLLHPEKQVASSTSDLCKLFRCASIRLVDCNDSKEFKSTITYPVRFQGGDWFIRVDPLPSTARCPRCLRHTRLENQDLCSRCTAVLDAEQSRVL